jgi:hypothetical protein
MRHCILTLAVSMLAVASSAAQSVPDACGLLDNADVVRLLVRGKTMFHKTPETFVVGRGKGSLCDYTVGGQVAIFAGPNSAAVLEDHLKAMQIQSQPRESVPGIGDKAFLFYPKPTNDRDDKGPYLVMTVGQFTVTAFLHAWKGQADGPMSSYCRDSANVNKDDKKACRDVMADKSEVPESLRPAAEELGKILVAKVREGKF